MNARIPWRRRLSELGRGVGRPHAPLFAPLLYGVAAQIEALPPAEVTADPTLLAKNLVELGRALGTAALVVVAPSALEAEALGADVDRDTWPPRIIAPAASTVLETADFDGLWSRAEGLDASLEACRRLVSTQDAETPLIAALTGPAALLEDLFGGTPEAPEAWDFAGRALASLAREFAQRGAAALLLCERRPPAVPAAWSAALGTLANVARFHRIPALLAFDDAAPEDWPSATVACPPPGMAPADDRPHGLVVPAEPADWTDLAACRGDARVIVTAREVPADTPFELLVDQVELALEAQREPAA
jgi:acetophenone carboxylase